jgi:hypothetical protein
VLQKIEQATPNNCRAGACRTPGVPNIHRAPKSGMSWPLLGGQSGLASPTLELSFHSSDIVLGRSGASPYQLLAYSVALKNSTVRFSICTRSPGSNTMCVEPAIGRNWKERPAFSKASISLRLCRK